MSRAQSHSCWTALFLVASFICANASLHEADTRTLLSPRRLFLSAPEDWSDVSSKAQGVADDTGTWVQETATDVADQATMTFEAVKKSFEKANALIEKAKAVSSEVYKLTLNFGKEMSAVFDKFQPLSSIFSSRMGMIVLMGSKDNMRTLLDVVGSLLNTADELVAISGAVETLSTTCDSLYEVLTEELKKLQSGRRLLASANSSADSTTALQLKGSRRLVLADVDYTQLLGGLDFQHIVAIFHTTKDTLSELAQTLKYVKSTIGPHIKQLADHVTDRRLLEETIAQIKTDKERYEQAVTQIVPTWRKVEKATLDVCSEGHVAVGQIRNLDCRVRKFTENREIPSENTLDRIVRNCDREVADSTKGATCPTTLHSEDVSDLISDNSGFIGWLCVSIQYMITYSTAMRITVALLFFLLPGVLFLGFGWRFKDIEFWIEGFVAGFVIFSAIISFFIVWYGVCRGEFISTCDYRWTFLLVVALSTLWAFIVSKGDKIQLFFTGFDLGCIMGACVYLWNYYESFLGLFLDPDAAKMEMAMLLLASLLSGLLIGGLTLFFRRPAIVFCTSVIGGAFIMACFFTLVPLVGYAHYPGVGDAIAWLALTIIGIVIQYKVTNPYDPVLDKPKEGAME